MIRPIRVGNYESNQVAVALFPLISPLADKEMVQLVVQTEDGQRFSGSFSPSTTLHSILETHKLTGAEANAILTIVYMRRQVSGERELRMTALKDLGLLGGRAILRLEKRVGEVQGDTGSDAHKIEQSSHQTPSLEIKDHQTPSTEVKPSSQNETPSVEKIEQSQSKKSKVQDTRSQEREEQQECTFSVIPTSIFPQEQDNAMEEEPMTIKTGEEDKPLEQPMMTDTNESDIKKDEPEPMNTEEGLVTYQPIDFESS